MILIVSNDQCNVTIILISSFMNKLNISVSSSLCNFSEALDKVQTTFHSTCKEGQCIAEQVVDPDSKRKGQKETQKKYPKFCLMSVKFLLKRSLQAARSTAKSRLYRKEQTACKKQAKHDRKLCFFRICRLTQLGAFGVTDRVPLKVHRDHAIRQFAKVTNDLHALCYPPEASWLTTAKKIEAADAKNAASKKKKKITMKATPKKIKMTQKPEKTPSSSAKRKQKSAVEGMSDTPTQKKAKKK